MQTNTNNAEAKRANAPLKAFDVSTLGAGRKVELEGDLAAEFVPDKTGFTAGITLTGIFVNTKKVVSDKLTTSKRDENGKKFRNLHILKDAEGKPFGIWGTGVLDVLMKSVTAGKIVGITYKGRAKEALQQGQQPPMEFDIVEYQ